MNAEPPSRSDGPDPGLDVDAAFADIVAHWGPPSPEPPDDVVEPAPSPEPPVTHPALAVVRVRVRSGGAAGEPCPADGARAWTDAALAGLVPVVAAAARRAAAVHVLFGAGPADARPADAAAFLALLRAGA